MIPRIIHYTWFSGEEFPERIRTCMASWKRMLPDYEFKLWDRQAANKIDSIFLHEALEEKKWAYAADFVRLYAVYHEGGIYLDTDVEMIKCLEPYLHHRVFIGMENSYHNDDGFCYYVTAHCFGAEKNHPYIGKCLSYFEDRHFITSNHQFLVNEFRYNYVLLPYIMARFAQGFGYNWGIRHNKIQNCDEGLVIYPNSVFDGFLYEKEIVARHWALGGWRDSESEMYNERTYSKLRIVSIQIVRAIKKWLLKLGIFITSIKD